MGEVLFHSCTGAVLSTYPGDSAGGNLAAAVALKLRDDSLRPRPRLQLLLYPVMQGVDFRLPSMLQNSDGPRLTSRSMCYFVAMYLEGSPDNKDSYCRNAHVDPGVLRQYGQTYLNVDSLPAGYRRNYARPAQGGPFDAELWNRIKDKLLSPYFSPLLAPTVSGLPRTFVLTLENDPLRDEAMFYVLRLRQAGVPVTHRHRQGYHGDLPTRMDDVISYISRHL